MPVQSRPPPGHPAHFESGEYEPLSRSSSHSPPDTDELWADPDDLLAIPTYDASIESTADPLFPSPHKFNLMVQDYLRNLSPKKREKALLTQKMYDAVLSVLQDPKDTGTKTAQFRFWAKKMFQLTTFGGEKVVCHDHKPVAVKEQIYEVLCHCHGQAGHGGRDKTSAQVRRYYSWIPKEIIARFVRDCPFCQSRRTQSSAGFSNMSESQAFLISLQASDTQLQNKRSVSLSQARANAAALGHKPYRRPSLRTVDSCRSRRGSRSGSAVSDDGYIHYDDGPVGFEGAVEMAGYEDGQYSSSSVGHVAAVHNAGVGGGLAPHAPSLPRRASSYHEQIFLDVRPTGEPGSGLGGLGGMGMYRRNSDSNILTASGSSSTMIYAAEPFDYYTVDENAFSASDVDCYNTNGVTNHYLSVPNMSGAGTSRTLSRSTSSSSLGSLTAADELADVRQFAQQLHLETTTGIMAGAGSKFDYDGGYRDTSALNAYSVGHSEAVTPNFPLAVQFQNIESSYFPTDYMPIPTDANSYFPSTEYQFPSLTLTSSATEQSTSLTAGGAADDGLHLINGVDNGTGWNHGIQSEQQNDDTSAEALAMMQRMFDSNNIFALGEAAGMTQDQVVEMGEIDPRILTEFRHQMESLGKDLNEAGQNAMGGASVPDVFTADASWDDHGRQSYAMEPSTSTASTGTTGIHDLPSGGAISDYSHTFQAFELAFHSQNAEQDQLNGQPELEVEICDPNTHNDDVFAFDTITATNSLVVAAGCGLTSINDSQGDVNEQELDFSNWAGFVIS
ncbi:hypothetical protein IAR55_000866 [Kwoniella newhampshirensis]|uniref:Integrase zinc-binding domain-containing protein n=1 Tax=Kwoniella newhampshirensis TaxID=1651941 RepID=A0AAW0Z425_9TREE